MSTDSPALTLASTLQSASLNRNPSPHHDLNPSTAASRKTPVTKRHSRTRSISSNGSNRSDRSGKSARSSSEIPLSALKPAPRSTALPPLPDLRFEQSYLASLKACESAWGVAGVTVRDQVCFCLPALSYSLLFSHFPFSPFLLRSSPHPTLPPPPMFFTPLSLS